MQPQPADGMGWFLQAPTITKLMAQAVRGHLDCGKPDAVLNIETHLFNVTLQAESCDYALDVGKELWLNKSRWSRLCKEYVPADGWVRFRDQAVEILNGDARDGATANMLFRDPDRYAKKHRWGGCLMGATFRGDNRKAGKPTLTFYSRTTYMGYMGLLDAAIASRMAMDICDEGPHDVDLEDIGFRWHISSQQLHCFKTLPYVYSQPDLLDRLTFIAAKDTRIERAPPTWRHMAKWYNKVLQAWEDSGHKPQKMLANEKYGPFKRIKRRWLESQRHLVKLIPPTLTVDDLDFCKSV